MVAFGGSIVMPQIKIKVLKDGEPVCSERVALRFQGSGMSKTDYTDDWGEVRFVVGNNDSGYVYVGTEVCGQWSSASQEKLTIELGRQPL